MAAERRCDDIARLAVPDRAGLADVVRVAAALRVHGHPDPCPPQNQPSVHYHSHYIYIKVEL